MDSGNYTCTMMGMKATTSVELNIQPGVLFYWYSTLLPKFKINLASEGGEGCRLQGMRLSSYYFNNNFMLFFSSVDLVFDVGGISSKIVINLPGTYGTIHC